MRGRNAYYDRADLETHRAPVPVISIGNLSVGGTGKTPFVMLVVRRLRELGHRPAVLMRGYAAEKGGTADEAQEYAAAIGDTPVVVNANRVAGARDAAAGGATVVVLDDGFQHRRLPRDLDVVLLDATWPWGAGPLDGWTLPSGMLREPLSGLRRADVVVLTRTEQVAADEIETIERRIRALAPPSQLLRARTEVDRVMGLEEQSVTADQIAAATMLPVSGIGNPASFHALVDGLDARVVEALVFADHHAYNAADMGRIVSHARRHGADLVLTTRKDWVKLAPLWRAHFASAGEGDVALARVEIHTVLDDPDDVFGAELARVAPQDTEHAQ